jgi:hypothetical protein
MRADLRNGKMRDMPLEACFPDIVAKGQKIDHNLTQYEERRY